MQSIYRRLQSFVVEEWKKKRVEYHSETCDPSQTAQTAPPTALGLNIDIDKPSSCFALHDGTMLAKTETPIRVGLGHWPFAG